MKKLLCFVFIMTSLICHSQELPVVETLKYIDSVVSEIDKLNNTLLKECNLIKDFYGKKYNKCWHYYFKDVNKKFVNKVSISFNGLPEELCYYYQNNKVIRRDVYKIKKGHSKLVWSIYFRNDKEINHKGFNNKERGIGYDKIGQAYFFLSLANEYSQKLDSL